MQEVGSLRILLKGSCGSEGSAQGDRGRKVLRVVVVVDDVVVVVDVDDVISTYFITNHSRMTNAHIPSHTTRYGDIHDEDDSYEYH